MSDRAGAKRERQDDGAQAKLVVRRARPSDRDAIVGMSMDIWGGTDYLPLVWDEWLRDPDGVLLTATFRGDPVGVSKITVLAPGEVWLEGLRLHPKLQGKGLVRQINRASFREALKLRPKTIRYSTGVGNTASRHLGEIRGFWQVARAQWMWGRTRGRSGRIVRRARPSDFASVWSIIEDSDCLRLSSGLMACGWRFRTLDRRLARRLVEAGQCLVRPARGPIRAVALYDHEHVDRVPCLGFVEGQRRAVSALARDVLSVAAQEGHDESTAMLPVGSIADTVREAGYDAELSTQAVVYEMGARGLREDDEPFDALMARTLRLREEEISDALTDLLLEAAPRPLLRENVRDFVRRSVVPDTRRQLYGALRPLTDRLRTYELRGNMRAIVDMLIDRFGVGIDDVRIGTASATFSLQGRRLAELRTGAASLRLRIGPGFGPLFGPRTDFGADRQILHDDDRDPSSGRYESVTLWLTRPEHMQAASRALEAVADRIFRGW